MKIGNKAAEAMNKISADLVYANLEEMNRAYLECDEMFTVNIKHKFSPAATGIKMETEMSFNKSGKHRDVMEVIVNDEQQELFDDINVISAGKRKAAA